MNTTERQITMVPVQDHQMDGDLISHGHAPERTLTAGDDALDAAENAGRSQVAVT